MAKMKFKKGDMVIVITGGEAIKGKTGNISRVYPESNRVIVSGLNIRKKAQRPNPQAGIEGGLIEKEASIHASNVMFYDGKLKKGVRKRPA